MSHATLPLPTASDEQEEAAGDIDILQQREKKKNEDSDCQVGLLRNGKKFKTGSSSQSYIQGHFHMGWSSFYFEKKTPDKHLDVPIGA
ncbi:hypothetical protein EYF80_015554 [Liparis tanakae]|uniref:Uncharacterized protein n=1 Tax=Liparis tanakae TaxID=230148 RepID=A0A4Z2I995_9TELE|nr:hypothetical protein EYF80_015554 [Liparis tanakae]